MDLCDPPGSVKEICAHIILAIDHNIETITEKKRNRLARLSRMVLFTY